MNEKLSGNNVDRAMESFFEASVTPLVLLDRNFDFVRANSAYAEVCQCDPDDLPGRNLFEFQPSDARAIFDRVLLTGKPEEVTARPLSFPENPARGVTFWNWKLTPLLDEKGEVELIFFSLEDVTGRVHARVRAETDLRESDGRFHSLFENMVNGFVLYKILFDESGKAVNAVFLDVNPAWEKIVGLNRSEVLNRKLLDVFPWVGQDWFDIYERIISSGEPWNTERNYVELGRVLDTYYYIPTPGHMAVTFVDITDRVRAEDAVRQAAEEIQDLYNNAPCGYHSLDKDGFFVRMNDTELSWLGYAREEVIGRKRFTDVVTPAGRELYEREYPQFKEQGFVRDLEFEMIRKDGSTFPVLLSSSAIFDSSGNYVMSRGTAYDITTQKKAAGDLLESEERFRTAFEYASIGKALTAADGRLIRVNRAFCDMVGYGADELTSANFSSITHPDDVEMSMGYMRSLLAGERKTCQFEKRYIHKDGHTVFVSINTVPFTDAAGKMAYLITDALDVTERRKAEDKITRLNRVYSVLSKINEVIVRVRDVDRLYEEACRIAVENGRMRMAWIGLIDEATGSVAPVASAGHVDGYLDGIKVASADTPYGRGPTGTSIRENKHIVCNDFRTDPRMVPWRDEAFRRGYFSSAAFPLHKGKDIVGAMTIYSGEPGFFDEEEIHLLLSLADDISFAIEFLQQDRLRQQAENEVRRLNEELEQRVMRRTEELAAANEQLESFTYSVSHDLQAPLRGINGYTTILDEDYANLLDDDGRRYLDSIKRNTRRMGDIINGLLDLSRVGRATITAAKLDMAAMARQVYDELSVLAADRTIEFNVGPCPSVHADAVLIHQVLQNLIANAIKFTRPRTEAKIEFSGSELNGEAVFCVKDNGAGFDMKSADQLFGVFRRLHGQQEFEGTGVGLALVKRIITMHGGRVWAESEVDRGARFYFALPV